jgi:dTDP-glucose pyrophosphorylase
VTFKILIPMAGLGSRFLAKGIETPKPLIAINGQPMIIRAIDSLGIPNAEYLFVISESIQSDFLVNQITNKVSAKFIVVPKLTEGPACSALLFKAVINNDDELIIANCDQIMEWDSNAFLINVRRYDGAIVTYHETTQKNSYAKIDANGLVTQVAEKQVISNISLNGIHYWKKGCYFVESAEQMIQKDDRAPNGEFYVGPTYNYLIADGKRIGIYHIPNQMHHSVGTPDDLNKYLKHANFKAN